MNSFNDLNNSEFRELFKVMAFHHFILIFYITNKAIEDSALLSINVKK